MGEQNDAKVSMFKTVEVDCPVHGIQQAYTLKVRPLTGCPACGKEDRERDEAAERDRRRIESVAARIALAGLSGRFAVATFGEYVCDNDGQRMAVEACRSFVSALPGEGGGLFLVGSVGTGKTHLASAMCLYLIDQSSMTARIMTARELIRALRGTWRKGADVTEGELINQMADLDLLVLDEVGVDFGSEAERVQLFDVIDLRYRRKRPTVVVSNLPLGQIKANLGGRIYDRLRDSAQVVVCDWQSYRGRAVNGS